MFLSEKIYNIKDILCDIEFVKKKKVLLSNISAVFDIESTSFYDSNNEKCSTMYAWVFGINGKCCVGRTWREFIDMLKVVREHYNISLDKRLVVYVHNLSFEFQFFRHYFEWETVFSIEERKPIYAITVDGIEFRCSYILSGYSLESVGKNLNRYKVNKCVGDLNYDLMRHSKSALTDKEWGYIIHDGLVVMAFIQEEIENCGGINNIPLTQTGYIRQLCRYNCLKGDYKFEYSKLVKNHLRLTTDDYKQLKRAFMGGFTHANINYVDRVIENVTSYDFTSSYPTVLVAEKFPMGKLRKQYVTTMKQFISLLKSGKACIFDITFNNIRSKVNYENYISRSRCIKAENYVLNNGRIVEADSITLTLTEQDFFIISEMYEWDSLAIGNFKTMVKGYLPKPFIETVLKLYSDKTTLKGVVGKEVEYMKAKQLLNSLYGMCCTDICRDEIIYTDEWHKESVDIYRKIVDYNNDKQRFLFYAWGVWVTAYARRNLFTGINEFKDDYIYSDTDSIKVLNVDKHIKYINNYNIEVTNKLKQCLKYYELDFSLISPKTITGKVKPLGVWDFDGHYNKFKTLGAKRYIVTDDNDDIHITIAGVSKKSGKDYLLHKYKSIEKVFEAFQEDLEFPKEYTVNGIIKNGSGKLLHTYIDIPRCGKMVDHNGVEYEYHELSGVHLEPVEYSLSLDYAFKQLIKGVRLGEIY